MIVYDKKQKQIVIPSGIGNLNLFNNGVEVGYEQGKIDGINIQKAKLESINITENGTYSIDDQETIRSIAFDGYSYFNTGIFPTENIKIEACIKITNGNNSGLGGIIIGGGIGKLGKNTKSRGIAIGMDGGGIYGIWGAIKSRNKPYKLEGEGTTTVVLQKTDDSWVWDGEKGSFGASGLYIGGYNSNDIAVEKKFLQSIVYIKIWTDRNDDSTLITYTPKTNGNFDANGVELQRLGDGTTTFVKENVIKYPYGFKRVEVNVPDLNGSYDEGYAQGKTDGINEQKSKLESISITENGTYDREDGYNHIEVNVPDLNGSYDEGYDQGQADVAANARVLEVTENGVYKSKYSDKTLLTEPTGIYENGDLFFDYAYLKNIQYNTNIYPMSNTKMEIWWKYDGSQEENEGCIIGCQNWGYANSIFKIGWHFMDNGLLASINDNTITIPFIAGWNHIVMSYADGLWLNGEKIGVFPSNITDDMDKKEPICINGYYGNSRMNSDYFGMVKINDVVFIPTENGFLNTSTNELLPIRREGEYTYTSVVPKYDEPTGELYKTINVNVIPKINVQKEGLRFGYSKFTEVPEWADFEGITDLSNMFMNCGNLQTIPLISTSNVTNMSNMFNDCTNLKTIPLLDTSNVTNMNFMFGACRKLQTIPQIDTSNVTIMSYMFTNCSNLQTIPPIDTSNVTDMGDMFYNFSGTKTLASLPKFNCQKVTNMRSYFSYYGDGMSALTDVGGWENLKCNWNDREGLATCPNLTYQSCINVLNGLYDFTGNGETPNSNQGKLKVHQNFLDKVGEEISIGINKGWTITA